MNATEYVRTRLTEFVRIPSSAEGDLTPILAAARDALEAIGLHPVVHEDVRALTASAGSGGLSAGCASSDGTTVAGSSPFRARMAECLRQTASAACLSPRRR